ncbi:PEGA domain-containing protein [Kribbella solani]|uniref:PEGA domain-containing protein n=1 Tax=Kribbella solani TaxID=236067 RepID=A0A841E179_9ACTN|nr:PEGA domain-containing protein [Kribbella solani]MBB5982167.1 hypothetical protein [Kribbella solani]MDX2973150.1 PEGA domain-containing protein [Kribbella solani]MDX3003972.1 PEGA domain-containing protein [Kribbella solani]
MPYESRRPLMIAATVVVVLAVLIGGFLLLRGGSDAKLAVQSIPNDLTLTVDGHQVAANGDVKIKPGTHTVVGERRGFQSYTTTITARSGDNLSLKMYLYANSSEGREWAKKNPSQELELEAEAGRQFDQIQARLKQKYPIMAQLPYIGPGFEANYTSSKTDPKNPEAISVTIDVFGPNGRTKALQWLQFNGWDPAGLDIIWSTSKP